MAGAKIGGAVFFVAAAAVLFREGKLLEGALAILFVGLIAASNFLNRWQIRRWMATSPFGNEELTIQLP